MGRMGLKPEVKDVEEGEKREDDNDGENRECCEIECFIRCRHVLLVMIVYD